MSLPYDVEELREVLNRYVELEKENDEFRATAVSDARTISRLRGEIGRLHALVRSCGGDPKPCVYD